MPSKNPVPHSTASEPPESDSFESIARRMLDDALALHADGRSLGTREIHECVKSISSHAKQRGLHAEHMLIELKRTWYAAGDSGPHPKSEVISHLVTMCIHEYYGVRKDTPGG